MYKKENRISLKPFFISFSFFIYLFIKGLVTKMKHG